ncbi:hypothetical protein [Dickeya zeae]|nr:hypothetical protein [Dickeya zeae]
MMIVIQRKTALKSLMDKQEWTRPHTIARKRSSPPEAGDRG